MKLTPDIVTRMDRPGPRYTSYPTAPVFTPDFGPEDYVAALKRASRSTDPFSLYVHLPFCQQLCTYCACNVVVRKDVQRAGNPYLDRVFAEADRVLAHLGQRNTLCHMHLGGGTPNYLERDQLEALMEGLRQRFRFTPDAELALEVDPRHVDDGQLEWLKSLGFNRVSFGIQDVEPEVQNAIGRIQTWEQTKRAFDDARAAGFESVNMDLVYGLPAQNRESFARTVDRVIELAPDRLAIFSFAYVPSVKPHQKKLPGDRMPQPILKATLLVDAINRLTDAGYVMVGMDHFAKEDDELARSFRAGTLERNFQGYVPGPHREILGLGVTAIGDIGGAYVQNHHRINAYDEAVDAGTLPVERGWTRTPEDGLRQAVIKSIMCRFRLDFAELKERFGVDHDEKFGEVRPALEKLAEEGLVELGPEGVKVTELGRIFVRNVAMLYDAYLPNLGTRFSRTV